jgi:hypothetical protein
MPGNGQHRPATDDARRRRTILIGVLVVLALLVFTGGYVLGTSGGEEAAPPSSTTPSPSLGPSPTSSSGPTQQPSPTAVNTGDAVEDGTYFVQLKDVQGGEEGPLLVRYDLAYFLTGDEANEAAAEAGDETPVPNDYYIVNDNPKLRLVPLATDVTVRYIPTANCCEPVEANEDQFLEWMGETNQTDFPDKRYSYWWITVEGGQVTEIEQQYLP